MLLILIFLSNNGENLQFLLFWSKCVQNTVLLDEITLQGWEKINHGSLWHIRLHKTIEVHNICLDINNNFVAHLKLLQGWCYLKTIYSISCKPELVFCCCQVTEYISDEWINVYLSECVYVCVCKSMNAIISVLLNT